MTVSKVFCDKCSRKIKSKQKQVECSHCKKTFHKLCTNLNNSQYRSVSNSNNFICLNCQIEIFPFSNQNNSNLSLINSGFHNFQFSDSTNIFPNDDLKNFFTKFNSLETPFSDIDYPVHIDSKYYDLNDFNETDINKHSSFSALHLNIASLSKHFEDLENFLSLLNHSFDLIGLSEHKINKNSPITDFTLPGYNFVKNLTESSHGGTGIFVSKQLNFRLRNDLTMNKPGELESTFIELILPNRKNVICACIYKHPRMDIDYFNEFFLAPKLNLISNEDKTCLLMGDFNINLLNVETKKAVSNFYDLMCSHFFAPYILQPTRIVDNSKTLIDNIFMNCLEFETFSGNLTSQISDHLVQFIVINNFYKQKPRLENKLIQRNYQFFNKDEFKNDLKDIIWENIFPTNESATSAFDKFYSTMIFLLDEHAPLHELTKKEMSLKVKPWITKKIQFLMKLRDKKYKLYCKESDPIIKEAKHNDFKIIRNQVTFQIKNSKQNYYKRYFEKNSKNVKKVWEGIKSIVTLKSKANGSPKLIIDNKKEITDTEAIATIFNDYFVNVGSTLAKKIPKAKKPFSFYLKNNITNSFFLNFVTEAEIEKIVNNLSCSKSSGPYSIPTHILKDNINILKKPLAKLINMSFQQGMFPESLKSAKVTPIYKKDDPQISSNYRPISVLSVFSKIYEKCMHTRLYSFLTKHELLFRRQFGFRKNHSTNHALISLVESIKKEIDNQKFVYGIFIDLQKAFDTVDHDVLIQKLNYYGVRGIANHWFCSFLKNRNQYVSLSGVSSHVKQITCGVPQGSTLGPLLFLIYINDLHKIFTKATIHHFADDTNLMFSSKKLGTIESVVNHELKVLVQWLRSNKLSLNETKTELIVFRSSQNHVPRKIDIRFNKYRLKPTKQVKYLGIFFDEVLSWNKQIENLCLKLSRTNGVISKLRHYVPLQICKSVYFSIFYSYLLYGCLVWSYTSQNNIERLTKLQKRCTRLLTFSEFLAHTNPLYYQLQILKITDIFTFQKIIFMLETFKGTTPVELQNLFVSNKNIHSYATRSRELLHFSKCNTTKYGLNSISYDCAKVWNDFYPQFYQNNIFEKGPVKDFMKTFFLNKYI